MATAINVVRYLKGTVDLGIRLSSKEDPKSECFCDVDWVSCGITRHSVCNYLLKFVGSLMMWKMKKQSVVSKSFAEAKYRALSIATSEIVWALSLLYDLQISYKKHANVYYDSIAAIRIAANPVFYERTKHIEVDCHFICEKWGEKVIELEHVRSFEQEADLLKN